jgi:acetyl esterase
MTRQLHPEVETLLDRLRARGSMPLSALSVTEARAALEDLFVATREAEDNDLFMGRREERDAVDATDLRIPGSAGDLHVRVYVPPGEGPFPVLAFFHGGGWVRGNLDSHDHLCREFADRVECAVVSVDYRRPPEHPFPAPVVDCYDATAWVAANAEHFDGDPNRFAVGGTSAGGNLAAATALLAQDRDGPAICHQLLVYPITDRSFERPSYEENAEGYLLTRASMEWYWDHYLETDVDARNALAVPLRTDDLRGVPPATVLTCEFDPLRDEGRAFARRLRAADVPVSELHYDDVIHAFLMFDQLERAREAFGDLAAELEAAFST